MYIYYWHLSLPNCWTFTPKYYMLDAFSNWTSELRQHSDRPFDLRKMNTLKKTKTHLKRTLSSLLFPQKPHIYSFLVEKLNIFFLNDEQFLSIILFCLLQYRYLKWAIMEHFLCLNYPTKRSICRITSLCRIIVNIISRTFALK